VTTFSAGTAELNILPKVSANFLGDLSRGLSAPIAAEGQKISSALGKSLTAGKVLAIGAFAAIAGAAVKGMSSAVSATEDWGSSVLALHRIVGGSVEDASRLDFVLQHMGLSTQQSSVAIGIFNKNVQNGTKYTKEYGISATDAQGNQLSFNQVLGEAADAYVKLGGGEAGAALAQNLFGRSGKAMIPVLQLGAQGIADLAAEADKYGLVLTGSNLEAIHNYSLAQKDLALANTGLKLSIGEQLIPVLTTFAHVLTVIVSALRVVPGPVKAIAIVTVGLGAALTALGLVVGIVRTAFGNLTGTLGAATAATEANTVATEENAAAHGGVGGLLSKVPGLAGAAALAFAVYTTEVQANAASQKQAAEGHTLAANALKAYSITLDIASAGTIPLTKWVIGLFHANKDAAVSAKLLGASVHTMGGELDGTAALAERAGRTIDDTAGAMTRMANIATVKGSVVVDAWLKVGRTARYASDNVQTLHTQIVALPNGKEVVITLPGLAAVRASLRALHSEVEAIAGTYGITYVIHTQGHAPVGHLAGGAVFRAAQGFTFMAGEANYPTPVGPGAEIVSNRGVEPLANDHLDRIGDRIARRIGTGGGSTEAAIKEAFKTAMWEMRELFGPRTISVQINQREIARAVADQGVWDS